MTLDRHPFVHRGTSAILLVSLMMAALAGLFLAYPTALGATPLLVLFHAFEGRQFVLAAAMLSCAALAAIGAVCRVGWQRYLILVPQQLLLGLMALGYIDAARAGHYLDGTPMDWPHIAAEAIIISALWLAHLFAIVERARDPDE